MIRLKRISIRIALATLILAASAFGIWSVRHNRTPQNVPVTQVKSSDFLVTVHCRGSLVSGKSVELAAPLDIQDLQIVWLAPSGSEVKAQQAVVRFDPSKAQQDAREKTVALNQAQASLDQITAEARITSDQDKLDLASANFDTEKARLEASKQAIVSTMEGEKSQIDFGLSQQKVKLQQATMELHRKSSEAKIASQTRLRDEAQKELERAHHRLSQMQLITPSDGIVTYLTNRSQGWMNSQPYKVGDRVSAGLEIAEIPELKTLQMESKLDEVDRARIAVGNPVMLHIDAFPEKTFSAKVTAISALTEQDFTEWPPTRTFRAFALITDRDPRLRPGMNGAADVVQTTITNSIHIPGKALFTSQGKAIVYVRTPDGFSAHEVHVVARNTDEVAIEGLAAGATIAMINPEASTTR